MTLLLYFAVAVLAYLQTGIQLGMCLVILDTLRACFRYPRFLVDPTRYPLVYLKQNLLFVAAWPYYLPRWIRDLLHTDPSP